MAVVRTTPVTGPWAAEEAAALYERGRPDYPPTLVGVLSEQLALRPSSHVADVAAGTGKLTRVLSFGGALVTAVEPMTGMRAQLQARVPECRVVGGEAENLPLRTSSFDAITVGQAFHWFRVTEACHEFRRVLRPSGRLAVVSNQRHEPEKWVKRLWEVLRDYERLAPTSTPTKGWRNLLDHSGDFGPFSRFELPNQQKFSSLAEFDARFTSVSFVLLLQPEARESLVQDLHQVVEGIDPIVIPFRTVVEVADRAG